MGQPKVHCTCKCTLYCDYWTSNIVHTVNGLILARVMKLTKGVVDCASMYSALPGEGSSVSVTISKNKKKEIKNLFVTCLIYAF